MGLIVKINSTLTFNTEHKLLGGLLVEELFKESVI